MQQISKDLHQLFHKKRTSFVYPFVLSVFFTFSAMPAYAYEVHSPYPAPSAQNEAQNQEKSKDFACPDAPDPIQDLFFDTIYEDGDRTHSIVDEARMDTYKQDSSELYSFEDKLSRMSNLYISEKKNGDAKRASKVAACVQNWLYRWAKHDALLGEVNRSGELVRKWSLASLSSAYAEVRNDPKLKPERQERIEGWLSAVARNVMNDFSKSTEKNSRRNNHLYWAAWSVGITSYAVQDRQMLNWAMDKAKVGLDQVQPDGSLPLEMARGQRALLYHVFSISPLVMLAEIGRANKVDLYAYNDGALHRLITLSMYGLENPHFFEEKTGKNQEYKSVISPNGLAWLVPYNRRFSNKAAEAVMNDFSKSFINRRIGGNLQTVYGEQNSP